MGSVYEAVDLQTGMPVALKALQPGACDAIRLRRLRREAVTMTTVHSAHVCKVHYLGVERGTPFIVMERLYGETLRTRLAEGGALPAWEAIAIACQLLDALTATHAAGVVHRDVKPSNLFLTESGSNDGANVPHVKLIDFGLARVRAESSPLPQREITPAEVVAGTLHYLAPEQLLGGGDVDERVDVYAAAVTVFEMLTGRRAYAGTYAEVLHDICLNEPPLVTSLKPDLPDLLDDVMAMAMAKTRERRFASAHAFKRALLAAWESRMVSPASGIQPALHPPPLSTDPEDDIPTLRPPPFLPGDDDTSNHAEVPTLIPPARVGQPRGGA